MLSSGSWHRRSRTTAARRPAPAPRASARPASPDGAESGREERLVDRHVLQRLDALALLELQHPVDQQERDSGAAAASGSGGCPSDACGHGRRVVTLLLQRAQPLAQARAAAAAWRRSFPTTHCRRRGTGRCSWPGLRIERVTMVAADDVHVVGQLRWPRMIGAAADRAVARRCVPLPATPTQPAIAVCAPMCTLCADLDQVVELDAVLDHGVVERAAVDAGVGADLDVVADAHRAELLDLLPAALRAARSRSRRRRSPRRGARCSARRCVQRSPSVTRAASRVCCADTGVRADSALRADHAPAARSARRARSPPARRCAHWRRPARSGRPRRSGARPARPLPRRARRPPLREPRVVQVRVGA